MGDRTAISWVKNPDRSQGATWNPLVGCTAVSMACGRCYAARLASTRLSKVPAYAGLAHDGKWTGEVRLLHERLDQPWRWRKPRGIFLGDMSDLFHEAVPDSFIARCFAIMQTCEQHTFYVLTKRAERLARFTNEWDAEKCFEVLHKEGPCLLKNGQQTLVAPVWPPRNIVGGVTAENQKCANERAPWLLQAKLAIRFISCEPKFGEVDLSPWLTGIDWVIVGGQNDLDADPFDIDGARRLIRQCEQAGVPVFMKQLGTRPFERYPSEWPKHIELVPDGYGKHLVTRMRHRAGADPAEWPEDLRVQQMHRPLTDPGQNQ